MKRIIGSIALISLLSACATPYQPIPFDRASAKVDNLQIVEDAMGKQIEVRKYATNGGNIASAASGYGLAGLAVALVAAGVEAKIASDQRTKIDAALKTQNFDAEAIFDAALEAALKADNYNISVNTTARDDKHSMVVVTKQDNAAAGTAVLDVNGSYYGYQEAGGGTNWRPYVYMTIKMLDAKDPTKVLLDNVVEYNAVTPQSLTVSLPANPIYSFAKIEDLEANPKLAAEGLTEAITDTAKAVAKLLK